MSFRTKIREFFFPGVPGAASMESWAERDASERKKPVRYFLARTFPSWCSVKMMRLRDVKLWFMYRLNPRHFYHIVRTGLEPGYYDCDTRMLHANFNILKNFVEEELSSMQYWNKKKNDPDWIASKREAGLAHLDWEISLVHHEGSGVAKTNPLHGTPTGQALAAMEKKELYMWWVEGRPNRKDAYDLYPDPHVLVNGKGGFYAGVLRRAKHTPSQKQAERERHNSIHELEESRLTEDDDMLIRLMKVRRSMWT